MDAIKMIMERRSVRKFKQEKVDRELMKEIIDIQLEHLRRRLKERNITIELSDAAKQLIVDEGYDPAYGARPLKRVLQQRVADALALQVLQGAVTGGDHILVDALGQELTFSTVLLGE